jgi:hypothetical protein
MVPVKAELVKTLGEGAKGAVDTAAIAAWMEANVAENTRVVRPGRYCSPCHLLLVQTPLYLKKRAV